jgi:hypothetical protein
MDDYENLLLREGGYPHLVTKKLDDACYSSSLNQKEFSEMTKKGAAAWADVEDADEWLENLRSVE